MEETLAFDSLLGSAVTGLALQRVELETARRIFEKVLGRPAGQRARLSGRRSNVKSHVSLDPNREKLGADAGAYLQKVLLLLLVATIQLRDGIRLAVLFCSFGHQSAHPSRHGP